MIKAAKVLIRNDRNELLVLIRNEHPLFGNSVDLPGGTAEMGESLAEAAVREVREECGIELQADELRLRVTTRKYSRVMNEYTLFEATITGDPQLTLSWEHKGSVWMSEDDYVKAALATKDGFAHMSADFLQGTL